jgi:hypothetical protein
MMTREVPPPRAARAAASGPKRAGAASSGHAASHTAHPSAEICIHETDASHIITVLLTFFVTFVRR